MPQFSRKEKVSHPCLQRSHEHQTHLSTFSWQQFSRASEGRPVLFSGLKEPGYCAENASRFLTSGGEQKGRKVCPMMGLIYILCLH